MMRRLLFFVLCTVHVGLFSMQRTRPLQGLNIKFLKGTHTVLPDVDYAPFWGLTFLENDVAKQWYVLSARQIGRDIQGSLAAVAEKDKESIVKILSEQKNTFTQNLVAQMFHVAGGTFNVTNAPNNPVRQFMPKYIGSILRIVHDGMKQADLKLMQAPLEKYLVSLGLLDATGKQFKAKDFRPFVNALIGALGECTGDRSLYAKNSAQGLLLGYLLAKSNSRQDLQEYFRGFLADDSFVLSVEEYSKQEFKELVGQVPDLSNVEAFANYFCAAVYSEKYESVLPKIVAATGVSYRGNNFTNCVEAMMSNLANIVTYDAQDKKLGKAPKGLALSSELQAFYRNELHANSADVDNKSVHQGWTALLENKIGVAYNRLAASGTTSAIDVRTLCDGVIPVDTVETGLPVKVIMVGGKSYQLFEKQVGNKKYWLVPSTVGLDCFELMPTASNIIVTMNNLFDLKLYASIEDVLQANFVEQCFSKMCKKLGWHVDSSILKDVAVSKNLVVSVGVSSGEVFKIHLYDKAHAYVSVKTKGGVQAKFSVESVARADFAVQAACISSRLVLYENVESLVVGSLSRYAVAINLDSRLELIEEMLPIAGNIIDVPYLAQLVMSMGSVDDMHYVSRISRRFVQRQSDVRRFTDERQVDLPIELINAFGVMADTVYVQGKDVAAMSIYTKIAVQRNISLVRSVGWIKKAAESSDAEIQILIDEGVSSELVNAMEVNNMLDWNDLLEIMRIHSLQFWVLKIVQNKIDAKLLNANEVVYVLPLIDKGMQSGHPGIQTNALRVIPDLIDRELIGFEHIDTVLSLIDKGVQSSSQGIQANALHIVSALIDKGLIDGKNVAVARKLLDNEFTPKESFMVEKLRVKLNNLELVDLQGQAVISKAAPGMLRRNRGQQTPDAKFVAEAKRQYSTSVERAQLEVGQREQMALMEQQRVQFEEQRDQMAKFNEQGLNNYPLTIYRDIPVQRFESTTNHRPPTSVEMIAVSRAAAGRVLPKIIRGAIR